MVRLNEEQEATLEVLSQLTERRKALKGQIEEEFEIKFQEQAGELDGRRLRMVNRLLQQGVPKRRLSLAMGTKDWYAQEEMIRQARSIDTEAEPEPEEPGKGTASHTIDGETLTVTLDNWPGLGSGVVVFSRMEDEWMVRDQDDFSVAVERALFVEPDPELKAKLGDL